MYAATVNGKVLTFEPVLVYRRNMIMRDRETRTVWQHATGEALRGPLQGARLEPLASEQTRWKTWRSEHPHTTVAIETADTPQSFIPPRLLNRMLLGIPTRFVAPGLTPFDRRLDGHAEVVGLALNGEARAYPLGALEAQGAIEDHLGGVAVRIVYEPQADRVRAYRANGGGWESLQVERQWWLAWSEFHPGTSVYESAQ